MARRRLGKLKILWREFVQNEQIKEAGIIEKIKSCGKKVWRGEGIRNNIIYRQLYFAFRYGSKKFNVDRVEDRLRLCKRKGSVVLSEEDIDLVLEVLRELWNKDIYRKARAHNLKVTQSERGKSVEFDSDSGSDSDFDYDPDEIEDDISDVRSDGSYGSPNSNISDETPITRPRKRRKLDVIEPEEDNYDDGNYSQVGCENTQHCNYDSRLFHSRNTNSFFKPHYQDPFEDPDLFEAFKDPSKSQNEKFETFLWQKFPELAVVLNRTFDNGFLLPSNTLNYDVSSFNI